MNKFKKLNTEEIFFFFGLHYYLKPKSYLQLGVDYGRYLSQAHIETNCIGIDRNIKIIFPISPRTRLIKFQPSAYLNSSEFPKIFGGENIDIVFINKYRNKYELKKILTQVQKRISDKGVIVIKASKYGMVNIDRFHSLNINLGDSQYLILSQRNLKDLVNKIKNINKIREIKRYKYYTTLQKKSGKRNLYSLFKKRPRCLGVLLCYNDGDILEENILHLLKNNHDIIVWDHGSNDNTKAILDKYSNRLLERRDISRDFSFYQLYQSMSKNLIDNYIHNYDIISWPDQDEILEGPDRENTYFNHIKDFYRSQYSWIRYNNFVYWMTNADHKNIPNPSQRLRYYSLYSTCSPRIRTWKTCSMNIRFFNHNQPLGEVYYRNFNLKHYPMRTPSQLLRRLKHDRKNIERPNMHFHYYYMKHRLKKYKLSSKLLHYDSARENLNRKEIFDWRKIYGSRETASKLMKNT